MITTPSGIVLPDSYRRNAQLATKVVFWYDAQHDHILQGGPEHVKPFRPYTQVVCTTAAEAECWSEKLRQQDARMTEASNEQRDAIEGRIAKAMRAELVERMNSAPTQAAFELCRKAIARHDELQKRRNEVRTTYLHSEAYEHGK
jgi:hypothetical protein